MMLIVLISAYFELEMWKLQKESVNAELNSMYRRSYPTRWLKADTTTVTLTVTDIYCVNIIKKKVLLASCIAGL